MPQQKELKPLWEPFIPNPEPPKMLTRSALREQLHAKKELERQQMEGLSPVAEFTLE